MNRATNTLAKYFGLYTTRDLAGRIGLEQVLGRDGATRASFEMPQTPPAVINLIADLVDTSEGGLLTTTFLDNVRENLAQVDREDPDANARTRYLEYLKVHYGSTMRMPGAEPRDSMPVRTILNIGEAASVQVNGVETNPDRDQHPGLAFYQVNEVGISPAKKHVNSIVIFLSGVPNLELSRAIPYLDLKFQFQRDPYDDTGRLQPPSIWKFLEGARQVRDGTALSLMVAGSTTRREGTGEGQSRYLTSTGMDLFTAPQTLLNANERNNHAGSTSERSAPILDKFRPFMSLTDFDVDVAPSVGLMSFKTAKLSLVVHDRSRLSEVAEFIRPDLYGTAELEVEYGWHHPDGPERGNPYADLINGMRVNEKYGVINSSLGFDDAGQVKITLSLAMRGGSEFRSEVISTDEGGAASNIIREIESISRAVAEYRRRIFGASPTGEGSQPCREIRGVQILDAAEDSRGHLVLSTEMRRNLDEFRRAVRHGGGGNGERGGRSRTRRAIPNEAANNLLAQLDSLYGDETSRRTRPRRGGPPAEQQGSGGSLNTLRVTVQESIARKLRECGAGEETDPFLMAGERGRHISTPTRRQRRPRGRDGNTPNQGREFSNHFQELPAGCGPAVSLAKILGLFVGVPLAQTRKFDEVQLLFYPFNTRAGYANAMTTANFSVDTRFFMEQYTRYRLENTSRAANMNLADFLVFLSNIILSDPAAESYGLFDDDGAFYEQSTDESNGDNPTIAQARYDAIELQSRMETRLSQRTPGGEFRMPQVEFYVECVPERPGVREGQTGSDASILRIHCWDRAAGSYETQQALLASARDEELQRIASIPWRTDGEPGVRNSQEREAEGILAAARSAQLIESVGNPDARLYRVTGGQGGLKEFVMKTTPYIIFGAAGTTVRKATLQSQQDAALSTVNMLRSLRADPLQPNGESPGGLPLRIIPCELTIDAAGCPLIDFAQQFFVDFQTGTTADNIYGVTGVQHKFSPGKFETNIKLAPMDAFGKYQSLVERVHAAADTLRDAEAGRGEGQG